MENSKDARSETSLLSALLGDGDAAEKERFILPAMGSPLCLTMLGRNTGAFDWRFNSMTLYVDYEYRQMMSSQKYRLDVWVQGGNDVVELAVPIRVTPRDESGMFDGEKWMRRIYPAGTVVTMEAPERYGDWKFAHWETPAVQRETGRGITVNLSADQTYKAFYEYQAGASEPATPAPRRWTDSVAMKKVKPTASFERN